MQMLADIRVRSHRINQFFAEIFRMRSRKTESDFGVILGKTHEKFRKIKSVRRFITIHILSEQRNLAEALCYKPGGLVNHCLSRAGALSAASIWHNAIRTEIVAASHNRNKRRNSVGT